MAINNLQKAIQALKEAGYVEKDIAQILTDWGKAAFARLYSEMMLAFSEEEIRGIEKIDDQKKMAEEIKKRFREKTGNDPDLLSQKYLEIIASEFLASRERNAAVDKPLKTL